MSPIVDNLLVINVITATLWTDLHAFWVRVLSKRFWFLAWQGGGFVFFLYLRVMNSRLYAHFLYCQAAKIIFYKEKYSSLRGGDCVSPRWQINVSAEKSNCLRGDSAFSICRIFENYMYNSANVYSWYRFLVGLLCANWQHLWRVILYVCVATILLCVWTFGYDGVALALRLG